MYPIHYFQLFKKKLKNIKIKIKKDSKKEII